jgi:hypothetical protein
MKIHFLIFTIGLVLGLFLSFMYCNSPTDTRKPVFNKKVTKTLEREVAKTEVNYTKAVDSLKNRSAKLQSELSITKTELSKAKQKNYSLQLAVYALLDKKLEDKQIDSANSDTSCDSLITTVEELLKSTAEKDSLYEKVTINFEDQLRNKDSTIELKEKQYSEVKSAFSKTIESVNELSAQNKLLGKQVIKQKFKSKVLSAVLFVLTGAAATYIIHH